MAELADGPEGPARGCCAGAQRGAALARLHVPRVAVPFSAHGLRARTHLPASVTMGWRFLSLRPLGSCPLRPCGRSGQILSASGMGVDGATAVARCAPRGLLSSRQCCCVPTPPGAPRGPGAA